MMWWLKWSRGRQEGGYEKLPLLVSPVPIPFDVYLIRYKTGDYIAPHVDPVGAGRHYRLNLILTTAEVGGEFVCKNPIFETRRIKFFRPDVSEHAVTRITKGSRLILSVGWIR